MQEINLCINCKERPVHIKKRGLCLICYGALRREHGPILKGQTADKFCSRTQKKMQNSREIEFIKNFFNHNNWVYQPTLFRFNGEKYSPDFYDAERNVFIEVSGSRQAYHQSKDKYTELQKYYPKLGFEIRTVDGELLNEKKHGEMWEQQLHN